MMLNCLLFLKTYTQISTSFFSLMTAKNNVFSVLCMCGHMIHTQEYTFLFFLFLKKICNCLYVCVFFWLQTRIQMVQSIMRSWKSVSISWKFPLQRRKSMISLRHVILMRIWVWSSMSSLYFSALSIFSKTIPLPFMLYPENIFSKYFLFKFPFTWQLTLETYK